MYITFYLYKLDVFSFMPKICVLPVAVWQKSMDWNIGTDIFFFILLASLFYDILCSITQQLIKQQHSE